MKNVNTGWLRKISYIFIGLMTVFNFAFAKLGTNLEGCIQSDTNGYTKTVDKGYALYLCNDDAYVEGNLAKWSELDLLAFTVTLIGSGSPESTNGLDLEVRGIYTKPDGGEKAFDFITEVSLRAGQPAGCPAAISGALETIPDTGNSTLIRRTVTFGGADIPANTNCTYDYNMRLAIGASTYNGSTIQATVTGGNETLPLPSADIIPIGFKKDMSAVQGGSRAWTIAKTTEAGSGSVDFGDTCARGASVTKDVNITVSWVRGEVTPDGDVTVTTSIFASNLSQRDLNVSVKDILSNNNNPLPVYNCPTVTMPAETNDQLVCQFDTLVAESDPMVLTNVAEATFIDLDYSDIVINTLTAEAAVDMIQGTTDNAKDNNATVYDEEYIVGNALTFSVESVNPGNMGDFTNYSPNDQTTGPVNWKSKVLTSSGSVTFSKKIHIIPGVKTDGKLEDKAHVVGFDAFKANSNLLSIPISSDPRVSLTIVKKMPDHNEAVTFKFNVLNQFGDEYNRTIEMAANVLENNVTIDGLVPGLYNVKELNVTGYAVSDGNATRQIELSSKDCVPVTVVFNNEIADRPSVMVQKVTLPQGLGNGWEMKLFKNNSLFKTINTSGNGYDEILASNLLEEGDYRIEETLKDGWYAIKNDGDCDFTYVRDDNRSSYECTFLNALYSEIIIKKVVDGQDSTFTFIQNINESGNFNLSDGQSKTFSMLKAGKYTVSEVLPNDGYDLTDITCTETRMPLNTPPVLQDIATPVKEITTTFDEEGYTSIVLKPGVRVECTFTNTERGKINVSKRINGEVTPYEWTFTLTGNGIVDGIVSDGVLTFDDAQLIPGETYRLCERFLNENLTADWVLNGNPVTPTVEEHEEEGHFEMCYDFNVTAGETADFVIDNIVPGTVIINLIIQGEHDGEVFDFGHDVSVDALALGHGASRTFSDVPAGTYDVSQSDLLDFDFVSVVCNEHSALLGDILANTTTSHEDRLASVVLDHGETVECTFTLKTPPEEVVAAVTAVVPCDNCESSGSPALSEISAILMVFMTLILGLLYIRREEENYLN